MSSIWTPGGERPVPPKPPAHEPEAAPEPGVDAERGELTPEEQAQLEAELEAMQHEVASTPASVVIANHAVGLFQLAAIHLNQRPPNLAEGRLAIDAMAALVEGMAGRLGDEEQPLRDGLAQLRMAFVQLNAGGGAPPS